MTQRILWEVVSFDERKEGQKPRWINLGVAFQNQEDESFDIYIKALPLNGKLHLRKKIYDDKKDEPI
jgi:hypothetical protein